MSDEVLASLIEQYMRMAGPTPSFGWQGGEPLMMGVDFFRRVVEYEKQYGRTGQYVGNGFQTNGVLIDDEWAELFREYRFLIGVSLDGPEEVHDLYRRAYNGRGSFARVMAGIEILRRHQVEFNILSVVNDRTAGMPEEIYRFFLSQGFYHLQFIPCAEVDPATGETTEFSATPEAYGDFLCRLFDVWFEGGNPRASIRFFDNLLMAYLGQDPGVCELKRRCGEYVVIEYNGDVYPCDFLVEESLRLGNLLETPLEEIMTSEAIRSFAVQKEGPFPDCEACRWQFLCRNGCVRLRYFQNRDFKSPFYLCAAYKHFFAHTDARFQRLAERIRRQRQYEARRRTAVQRSRIGNVGRNAPCPCGSGKKYKQCCMAR